MSIKNYKLNNQKYMTINNNQLIYYDKINKNYNTITDKSIIFGNIGNFKYLWYDTNNKNLKVYYNNKWNTITKSFLLEEIQNNDIFYYNINGNLIKIQNSKYYIKIQLYVKSDTKPTDTNILWFNTE